MTVNLEGAGLLTGADVLAVACTDACLGVAVGVDGTAAGAAEMFETNEETVVEMGGFPGVEVVITGAEFTNTGSVEGIGFPSLVWSFTTFTRLTK